ncbi:helix-turn-helix transcriptional regulator [Clostridium oceanicum]|uniref:HTH cro/C1-type domain-containing protein n=1 Tax=Clostridium oceanicum TaxID=1543 RepID=A0ABP3UKB8_9CLOT
MMIEEKIIGLSWNKKLEILRRINGWSQDKAAKECKVTQKMYWSWENGKSYPSNHSRKAIAKTYHMMEDDIFDKENF